MYQCERCHYKTKWKGNLKNHLKRKIICLPKYSSITCDLLLSKLNHTSDNIHSNNSIQLKSNINRNVLPINANNYKCRFCNETFKHKSGRSRHENHRCAVRNKHMTELTSKLLPQIKDILEENNIGTIDLSSNDLQLNQDNSINNSAIQNNIDNSIDNSKHVNINNYGDEDISHITDEDFKEMLKDPFSALSKLINAIHFNDLKPENQNLRIPNIKNPFAETFKDGEWVVGNQYKLLCKVYNVKREILHQAFLRVEDQLDEKTKELYYEYRKASERPFYCRKSNN